MTRNQPLTQETVDDGSPVRRDEVCFADVFPMVQRKARRTIDYLTLSALVISIPVSHGF
jgi:hypothetical protein